MEMNKFLILFMMFSFSKMLTLSDSSADIKKLEGNLLYYYVNENYTEVEKTLKAINNLDKNAYKRDQEIIDYWKYIDDKMLLYENVAPDGLSRRTDHAFVVLGYQLNSDGSLKAEAKGRCDVAYESSKVYPNSIIYLTGGGTASGNDGVTEAGQMKDYLIKEKGLKKSRIVVEDKAMDTIQNAKNTMKLLYQNNIKTITVITSDYHIRRGNILFKGTSLVMAETLGKTPITLQQNAVYKTGRKTEGKIYEGYAIAKILDVKLQLSKIVTTVIKRANEIINYFLS